METHRLPNKDAQLYSMGEECGLKRWKSDSSAAEVNASSGVWNLFQSLIPLFGIFMQVTIIGSTVRRS